VLLSGREVTMHVMADLIKFYMAAILNSKLVIIKKTYRLTPTVVKLIFDCLTCHTQYQIVRSLKLHHLPPRAQKSPKNPIKDFSSIKFGIFVRWNSYLLFVVLKIDWISCKEESSNLKIKWPSAATRGFSKEIFVFPIVLYHMLTCI
jgi:hypothetical protein